MGWTSGYLSTKLGPGYWTWRFIMDISIIGIDLAKRVFQMHATDDQGSKLLKRRFTRPQLMSFLADIPTTTIAIEACGTSHFWGRYCQSLGHEVRIVPAQYVKPFVKRHKNDATDAEAICEAASRRNMRFVPIKSELQQSLQAVHRIRDRRKRDRTALANEIRGLLAEFGIVLPLSLAALRDLCAGLPTNDMPLLMRSLLAELYDELLVMDEHINNIDERIRELNRMIPECRRLMTIPGVGELNASAFFTAIGDASQFARGRDLAAWLGLVPNQHSSAGKERLLGISKRGDSYLRRILIHGARAYICRIRQRASRPRTLFEGWIVDKLKTKHVNAVAVAVANKLARMIWAVLAKGEAFHSPPVRTAV